MGHLPLTSVILASRTEIWFVGYDFLMEFWANEKCGLSVLALSLTSFVKVITSSSFPPCFFLFVLFVETKNNVF